MASRKSSVLTAPPVARSQRGEQCQSLSVTTLGEIVLKIAGKLPPMFVAPNIEFAQGCDAVLTLNSPSSHNR
jgi:hypothetical protein